MPVKNKRSNKNNYNNIMLRAVKDLWDDTNLTKMTTIIDGKIKIDALKLQNTKEKYQNLISKY